jgi:hypothetical protein
LDEDPPPLQVGYQYQYRHEGPYPWSDGKEDVSGLRVVTVTGKSESNAKAKQNTRSDNDRHSENDPGSLWRVEDYFENVDGSLVGYYDKDYKQHRQAVETGQIEIVVTNTPPRPIRYLSLAVDDQKTYTIHQTMQRSDAEAIIGESTMKIETERKRDQRIVTEAGAYLCRHFVSEIEIETTLFGQTSKRSATEESFWCDRIGWFVQRKSIFDPVTIDGELVQERYTCQSTLLSFNAPYETFTPQMKSE